MKPLNELTHLEKIHRFRQLAKKALDAYGLKEVRLKFIRDAGNMLFRVYELNPKSVRIKNSPYEEGQYLLRIHHPAEQKTDAIELEMEWLAAICCDTGLPIPEPIPALNGNFLVQISIPGIPEKRDCTILRWVKGRYVTKNIRPHQFRAQGKVMAQLHNHVEKWIPPPGLAKRTFDYNGLFKDDVGAGFPNSAVWPLLPNHYSEVYEIVALKTKQVMDKLGKAPEVYGLIHGDCGVDANILFYRGEAHIIDFDGSGFGYYLFDLALALEHCWEDQAYTQYSEALLEGYAEFRSIPDDHLKYIDLFRSAFYVYMGLWTMALDQTHPNSPHKQARHKKWLEYGTRFIERYLTG